MNCLVRESAGVTLHYESMESISLTLKNLVPIGFKDLQDDITYVGIDFGTSTTVVSYTYYDKISDTVKCDTMSLKQRLPDGANCEEEKIPTVIALYKNSLLVGKGASELKYELEKN